MYLWSFGKKLVRVCLVLDHIYALICASMEHKFGGSRLSFPSFPIHLDCLSRHFAGQEFGMTPYSLSKSFAHPSAPP